MHAFVYIFQGKYKECLCWENISIVVINNNFVFFVTLLVFSLAFAQYSTRNVMALILNNNIEFYLKILTEIPFWLT